MPCIPAAAAEGTGEGFAEEYFRLIDAAELLSDSEEETLLQALDEVSGRQRLEVAIVTTDTLEGRDIVSYADDLYDYCQFGYGENKDGVMLLVSKEAMTMLKRKISLLLSLVMVAGLTACGSGSGGSAGSANMVTHTWDKNEYYTVSLEAPETQEAAEEEGEETDHLFDFTKDSHGYVFTFLGDTFQIDFEITGYVYQTSSDWKEKYGETKGSFEDYKKNIEEGINHTPGAIIQVNGEDVVENNEGYFILRYYNTDGLSSEGNLECSAKIRTLDESVTVEQLLQDETVKAIFDSIKVEGK